MWRQPAAAMQTFLSVFPEVPQRAFVWLLARHHLRYYMYTSKYVANINT